MAAPSDLAQFLASVEQRAWRQAWIALRDRDTALDVVQDAMLKLSTHYAQQPEAEWPLLFQRILQNTIRDYLRRQKVRGLWVSLFSSFSSRDDATGEQDDPLDYLADEGSPTVEMQISQRQHMALIEEGLSLLPARQREAFLLRYWEEMDVAETAQIMGCSEGSVKTHCSRACHTLAKWLSERGVTL
ncbi:RNA polymerase sigma factor [Chitinibacter bivalviorum]|uniref:RNA polymerase sigma factor n=1 Tax=Chitinibacter bivalviorum TaxID=2739434 RepID=A0A7H9BR74_9NEIS|nr:RNA polymerase sigma factor [Chitinibacter bivalviorum]QLG89734.1 RNA polymerase sigma factor [Chitinibacter bivalviorum]